jgi:hypothetical protein
VLGRSLDAEALLDAVDQETGIAKGEIRKALHWLMQALGGIGKPRFATNAKAYLMPG